MPKEKGVTKRPSQADLRTLMSYVESRRQLFHNQCSFFPTLEWYHEFGAAIMVGILLSNCATTVDIESLTVRDCAQIQGTRSLLNEKMLQTLELEYREIVKNYHVLANNKTNKLLVISENQKLELDLLLSHRSKFDSTNKNPYAFGIPSKGQFKVIKVEPALKKFGQKCGAGNPELLKIANIQDMTLPCRLLDTSVNRRLFEARLFERNLPDVMLTICKISFILLDLNGFFEGDSVKMFHEHVKITAENFGKPMERVCDFTELIKHFEAEAEPNDEDVFYLQL